MITVTTGYCIHIRNPSVINITRTGIDELLDYTLVIVIVSIED